MTRLLFAGPVPEATHNLPLAALREGFVTLFCGLDDIVPSCRIDAIDSLIVDPLAQGGAGLAAIRRVRRAGLKVGVVLLTNADPTVDAVVEWLCHADHCLIGTLHPREIFAHLRAVERRRHAWASSRVEILGVAVDTQRRVADVAGRALSLTAMEYQLLELLMTRAGRCITKEVVLDHLYGGRDEPDQKIVDVFVCKIRRKIRLAGGPADLIDTLQGRGFSVRKVSAAEAIAA